MRIGTGYDAHRLVVGRRLILGGVDVPFERGLAGYSDADVLIHAVIDALVGAAKLGDIGRIFPNNNCEYLDIDSTKLLHTVSKMLAASGYHVVNIDSTIIAQAPKLASHLALMESNIAVCLGIDPSLVSVKATTEENMGFTGSGEGIAAQAVCLIEKIVN